MHQASLGSDTVYTCHDLLVFFFFFLGDFLVAAGGVEV